MTWIVGEAEVRLLIARQELEVVQPNRGHAERLLGESERHFSSAVLIKDADPAGAYQVAYSGYRKVAAALLAVQGLRATVDGGHVAVFSAVRAQFNGPSGSAAFRNPHVFRRQRHDAEYPDPLDPTVIPADANAMIGAGRTALADARRLIDSGLLDQFV